MSRVSWTTDYGSIEDITNKQRMHVDFIRNQFLNLASEIEPNLAEGRLKHLVRTHLQSACMWAVSSIMEDGVSNHPEEKI